jgi:hypothetical protein
VRELEDVQSIGGEGHLKGVRMRSPLAGVRTPLGLRVFGMRRLFRVQRAWGGTEGMAASFNVVPGGASVALGRESCLHGRHWVRSWLVVRRNLWLGKRTDRVRALRHH